MKIFIKNLPKAELHVHIEGTFEAELIFELAKRNEVELSSQLIEGLKSPFINLQSFLNLYFEALTMLKTEQDFYDLAWAYLVRARKDGVCHVEMFFNPQAHTEREIPLSTVINGLTKALELAQIKLGMTGALIMDFTRNYPVAKAMQTLEDALPFKDKIIAVGLDSTEREYPPELFQTVFARARQQGFETVAHAGEEGPAEYIWQAINLLRVKRIDHGVRCTDDEKLVDYLVQHQIPLTICPLSNIKLCVYSEMSQHPIMKLYDRKVLVTINSDDPAYFGGYIADNYLAVQEAFNLNKEQLLQFAINSFQASFIPKYLKEKYIRQVISYGKQSVITAKVLESIKYVLNNLPDDSPADLNVHLPAEGLNAFHIFRVHRDRQLPTDIRAYRKTILPLMGYEPEAPVIQIIGDSTSFGAELALAHQDPLNRANFARDVLESILEQNPGHIVLYGLTGKQGDVNALVNDWIEKNPARKNRVIGNAVSKDTPRAIEEWGSQTGDVKNILLVYPDAKFGEDVDLSDQFVPQFGNQAGSSFALCLEGGPQSFLQVVHMLGMGVPVVVVEKLRGPVNAACKVGDEYRPFFSAAEFLSLVKQYIDNAEVQQTEVNEEAIKQLKTTYLYDMNVHGPYDFVKHAHLRVYTETKKALFEKAFNRFFEQKLWEKLPLLTVINCEENLLSNQKGIAMSSSNKSMLKAQEDVNVFKDEIDLHAIEEIYNLSDFGSNQSFEKIKKEIRTLKKLIEADEERLKKYEEICRGSEQAVEEIIRDETEKLANKKELLKKVLSMLEIMIFQKNHTSNYDPNKGFETIYSYIKKGLGNPKQTQYDLETHKKCIDLSSLYKSQNLLFNNPLKRHLFEAELLAKVSEVLKSRDIKVFISYAWPDPKAGESNLLWVQPFLKRLAKHLRLAGIQVLLDVQCVDPGDLIDKFMQKGIEQADYVLLIGTESLGRKIKAKKNRAGTPYRVFEEFEHIQKRIKDKKPPEKSEDAKVSTGVIPILISGEYDNAIPEEIRNGNLSVCEWTQQTYIENFEGLIKTLFAPLKDNLETIWSRFKKQSKQVSLAEWTEVLKTQQNNNPLMEFLFFPKNNPEYSGLYSEKSISLSHYTQLTILPEDENRDRKKPEKPEKEAGLREKTIELKDIFIASKKPQTLLITGRAGIGKSTLMRWIQCEHETLWPGRYDMVILLPLRELQRYCNNVENFRGKESQLIATFIYDIYFEGGLEGINIESIEATLEAIGDDRILYALDGYDEAGVNETGISAPCVLLKSLFNKPNIIVTTRSHARPTKKFDRVLENVGFNDEQIKNYTNCFFKLMSTTTIHQSFQEESIHPYTAEQFMLDLEQNPTLKSACYVPLVLELVLSVKFLQHERNMSLVVSKTELYEQILEALLRRHLCKICKEEEIFLINASSRKEISERNECKKAIDFLGYIAFKRLFSSRDESALVLDHDFMMESLGKFYGKVRERQEVLDNILKLGFLKRLSGKKEGKIRQEEIYDYYFIHLAFQEFFAAKYIASILLNAPQKKKPQYLEMKKFIQQYKFDEKYEEMMSFVLPLLSNENARVAAKIFELINEESDFYSKRGFLLFLKHLPNESIVNPKDITSWLSFFEVSGINKHIPPLKDRLRATILLLSSLEQILVEETYQKGYDLLLMSDLPQTGPEKGKMYLEKQGSSLKYIVNNPKGEHVSALLDIAVDNLTKESLAPYTKAILKETSKRGHTHQKEVLCFTKKGRKFYQKIATGFVLEIIRNYPLMYTTEALSYLHIKFIKTIASCHYFLQQNLLKKIPKTNTISDPWFKAKILTFYCDLHKLGNFFPKDVSDKIDKELIDNFESILRMSWRQCCGFSISSLRPSFKVTFDKRKSLPDKIINKLIKYYILDDVEFCQQLYSAYKNLPKLARERRSLSLELPPSDRHRSVIHKKTVLLIILFAQYEIDHERIEKLIDNWIESEMKQGKGKEIDSKKIGKLKKSLINIKSCADRYYIEFYDNIEDYDDYSDDYCGIEYYVEQDNDAECYAEQDYRAMSSSAERGLPSTSVFSGQNGPQFFSAALTRASSPVYGSSSRLASPPFCNSTGNEPSSSSSSSSSAFFTPATGDSMSNERIKSGEINGKAVKFTIHETKGDGNCGFYALPIGYDRAGVRQLLLDNADNTHIRELVAPEIQDVVISRHMPHTNTEAGIFYKNWLLEYARLQQQPASEIGGKLDEHTKKLRKYLRTKEAFEHFVNHCVGGSDRLSYYHQRELTTILDAIAVLKDWRIHIYQEDDISGCLKLCKILGPDNGTPCYLHHVRGLDTHYELMSIYQEKVEKEMPIGLIGGFNL